MVDARGGATTAGHPARSTARPPALLLAAIALVALATRVTAFRSHTPLVFGRSDNAWYEAVARSLAEGHWGRLPAVGGGEALSIRFPPGYPAVLALGQRLLFWVEPLAAHQWTSAALGALAAVVVGVVAFRLSSRATRSVRVLVAALAGLMIAVNPLLVGASTSLMPEALLLPLAALVLLLVDRLVTGDATRWDPIVLGALFALAMLTRTETIATLGAALVVGLVLARSSGETLRPWAVALASGLVIVILWSAAVSAVADRPVYVSTNNGSALLGANCPLARSDGYAGLWNIDCLALGADALSADATSRIAEGSAAYDADPFAFPPVVGAPVEAEVNAAQQRAAFELIGDHPLELVEAVPARLARGFGVYWTAAQDQQEWFEGRDRGWEQWGRWFNLIVVLPAALLALVATAWRRSGAGTRLRAVTEVRRLLPSLAVVAAWTVSTMATYGSARFRVTIEPSLAVLAALGIAVVVGWARQRPRRQVAS